MNNKDLMYVDLTAVANWLHDVCIYVHGIISWSTVQLIINREIFLMIIIKFIATIQFHINI